MFEYVFEGDVVKLNATDYGKILGLYENLDVLSELQQLDAELEARRREGGSVKKWFSELHARFNGRNKRAARFGGRQEGKTQNLTIEQQLGDRSWAIPIKH